MAYQTCDWCGNQYKVKGFAADAATLGGTLTKGGLGLGVALFKGVARAAGKRHFCSEKCKREYEAEHEK